MSYVKIIHNLTTVFFVFPLASDINFFHKAAAHASVNARRPKPNKKFVIGPDQIYFRAFWER